MNRSISNLLRLARRAYKSPPAPSPQASPYGFSTRVASRWAASGRANTVYVWQRVCWWGATASLLICLSSAVYRATLPEPTAFDLLLQEASIQTEDF